MLFAVISEVDPVATLAFLESGHWVTPMSPQSCCQIVARLTVTRWTDLPQILDWPRGDSNSHVLTDIGS